MSKNIAELENVYFQKSGEYFLQVCELIQSVSKVVLTVDKSLF